jgi:hypothetical protein
MTVTEPDVVQQIVATILEDLTDRRGLRHEWDAIEPDIQHEIRDEWKRRIDKVLASGHEASYTVGEVTVTGSADLIARILSGEFE